MRPHPAMVAMLALGVFITSCQGHRQLESGRANHDRDEKRSAEWWAESTSVFGPANTNVNFGLCAGRIALTQGEATVHDLCFTGDTNVVLCTDATGANPIRCAPGVGVLIIAGTGNDVINYARVR
jgi:hypothetical protein